MPFRMTVDQPHLGEVGTVYIHGLGTFGNGTHIIPDALEQNFRAANTRDVGGYYTEDEAAPHYGLYLPKHEQGPSLVEAASSIYGVTVEEIDEKGRSVEKSLDKADSPDDKTDDEKDEGGAV